MSQQKEICPICIDEINENENKNISVTECGHTFHTSCLLNSIKRNNTCPMCRNKLTDPIDENVTFCLHDNHYISSNVYDDIDIDIFIQNLGLVENISNNEVLFEIIDTIISSTLGNIEMYMNEQNNHHPIGNSIQQLLVEDLVDIL